MKDQHTELLERIVDLLNSRDIQARKLVLIEEQRLAIMELLATRTFTEHITIQELAAYRKVTVKAVRKWIARRRIKIERIPGADISGVRIKSVFSEWQTLDELRAAKKRLRGVA